MKVLVGCEFSGVVRDAFIRHGHDAISCDLEPSETAGPHYQGHIYDLIDDPTIDLFIGFPPCTYLAVSGNRWHRGTQNERRAVAFVQILMDAPIKRICIENPQGVLSRYIRKPDQIIQPWQFGHGETKATHLWLKNLPLLRPTNVVSGRDHRIHTMPASRHRQRERSRTYSGIAAAMADQWG